MLSKNCIDFDVKMVHLTQRDMKTVKQSASFRQEWLYLNRSLETRNWY